MKEMLGGIAFWIFVIGCPLLLYRWSLPHRVSMASLSGRRLCFLIPLVLALIVVFSALMMLSPVWNGTLIYHKGQYEMQTESFLQGRLDLDIPVDPVLREMENPYDPVARQEAGADFALDHAYYQGHYYMYFGVVPVFLAFMPWRLIFGTPLLSVYATMWFTAWFVWGLTTYFLWLTKKNFPGITLGTFAMLLILFSLLSCLYVIKFPSLYQTPVACGMMLEIWSLYCFSRGVWEERDPRSALRWAWAGSLLGALTFGCRPPLALANLMVILFLAQYMKGKRWTAGRVGRMLLAASPYALVAAGLMWYNHARFGSPFEFGQTWQLTIADQSGYGGMPHLSDIIRAMTWVWNGLFAMPSLPVEFPFIAYGTGVFACCPMLLFSLTFLRKSSRETLQKQSMLGFSCLLMITAMIIVAAQALWAPEPLVRYKSDIFYLLAIGAFVGIGTWMTSPMDTEKYSKKLCVAAFFCILILGLFFLLPNDGSYTEVFPGKTEQIWNIITFQSV